MVMGWLARDSLLAYYLWWQNKQWRDDWGGANAFLSANADSL